MSRNYQQHPELYPEVSAYDPDVHYLTNNHCYYSTMAETMQSDAALDNTELISDAQWLKLAKLSFMFNLTVAQILAGLRFELNENARDDEQNMIGNIPISKTSHLHGLLHHNGSTHT